MAQNQKKSFGIGMQVTATGRLSQDAEQFEFENAKSKKVCFTLVIARDARDQRRDNDPDVDFLNCERWVSENSKLIDYLLKGKTVVINGRMVIERWTDRNGENRSKPLIKVEGLQLIQTGTSSGGNGGDNRNSSGDCPF